MIALFQFIIIVAFGLIIYGQTLFFGFVFDDHLFIVDNPYIKDLGRVHLMWEHFPMTRLIGIYSFAVNYALNQLHPFGYHLFNLTIHLTATLLVWVLADLLLHITAYQPKDKSLRRHLPFCVALIFCVHPCQTQAITYITQRFESLATVFYLATIICYLKARIADQMQNQWRWGLAALITMGLGLLTKEVTVTAPLMILVIEWMCWPKRQWHLGWLVGGGIIIALIFMKLVNAGFNIFTSVYVSDSHDGDILTTATYLLTQMRVFLTFLSLLIFPVNQNLEYDFPMSTGFLNPPLTIVGFIVIVGMMIAVWRLRRSQPLLAVAIAWIIVTFSINLAPRVNVIFEHKLYLISFGGILAFAVLLASWVPRKKIVYAVIGAVGLILSVIAFYRNQIWKNELTLWEDVVKKSPHKARVNANLGRIYAGENRDQEALTLLTRAITLNPKDDISWMNRGVIYAKLGQLDLALSDFNHAATLNPENFSIYVKRSNVFMTQGDLAKALEDLNKAIYLNSVHQDPYIQRGIFFASTGNRLKAIDDFKQALILAPYDYTALIDLGALLYQERRFEEALGIFNRAYQVAPNAEVLRGIGFCLLDLKRIDEAKTYFQRVLQLNPDDARVRQVYDSIK